MLKKIILVIIIIFVFYISTDIKSEDNLIEENIIVEVRGNINNPGIFNLKKGSTFNDLLDLIELKEDSDISSFSYQSTLYNGQIINIPIIKETQLISINSADLSELCKLPGIGEKTALRIIEYRNNIGSFKSIEDLKNVKGIGDGKFNKIKEYITL